MTRTITETGWPVWFATVELTLKRSGNPIAIARLEFLARFRYWLVNGGTMIRIAWGKMTRRRVCISDRPTAYAASIWPRRTAWIPPRTTSPMNAAV